MKKDIVKEEKYYFEGYYSIDDLMRILRDILRKTKICGSKVKSFSINLEDN